MSDIHTTFVRQTTEMMKELLCQIFVDKKWIFIIIRTTLAIVNKETVKNSKNNKP